MRQPLVVINAVGLTKRWLPHAARLQALASQGSLLTLREVLPAVTLTAQASFLTGGRPQEHGIVANGWLFRDTMEVRFWQQSNRLLQKPPFYETVRQCWRERGQEFTCAKLFWWYNQGAAVSHAVTPKPFYGADGNKVFAITGSPADLPQRLEYELGAFPFASFWGPLAGLPATNWIAQAAANVLRLDRPDCLLAYLPHLDYEPQRHGPLGCDMALEVRQLDNALLPLFEAAREVGATIWVVSEYGHCQVSEPIYLNRSLRRRGWLQVRPGPFGEVLDLFQSEVFAVCDHQLAHVYVQDPALIPVVSDVLWSESGVARIFIGAEREEIGLNHPRAGDLICLSIPDRWFAYPFWLDEDQAPDFARTVDIHRKPGFDPCEMLFDPALNWWQLRLHVARKLLAKKLGFRTLFNLIPLDAHLIHGSHGLAADHPDDRPLFLSSQPLRDAHLVALGEMPLTHVYQLLIDYFDLDQN